MDRKFNRKLEINLIYHSSSTEYTSSTPHRRVASSVFFSSRKEPTITVYLVTNVYNLTQLSYLLSIYSESDSSRMSLIRKTISPILKTTFIISTHFTLLIVKILVLALYFRHLSYCS